MKSFNGRPVVRRTKDGREVQIGTTKNACVKDGPCGWYVTVTVEYTDGGLNLPAYAPDTIGSCGLVETDPQPDVVIG